MTNDELLLRIWEKVEYLNHKTTQIETDMVWIKWLVMGIVVVMVSQAVGIIYKQLKNNK